MIKGAIWIKIWPAITFLQTWLSVASEWPARLEQGSDCEHPNQLHTHLALESSQPAHSPTNSPLTETKPSLNITLNIHPSHSAYLDQSIPQRLQAHSHLLSWHDPLLFRCLRQLFSKLGWNLAEDKTGQGKWWPGWFQFTDVPIKILEYNTIAETSNSIKVHINLGYHKESKKNIHDRTIKPLNKIIIQYVLVNNSPTTSSNLPLIYRQTTTSTHICKGYSVMVTFTLNFWSQKVTNVSLSWLIHTEKQS